MLEPMQSENISIRSLTQSRFAKALRIDVYLHVSVIKTKQVFWKITFAIM